MTDLSDAVQERMERAGSVLAVFSMHALEVAPALDPLLSTPAAPFDAAIMFASLKEAIETQKERLIVADLELTAEAADDKQYRDARDAATDALRSVLADVRSMFEAAYSSDILIFYGLAEEAPRSPELLLEHAERAATLMEHKPLSQHSPYGFDLELGALAGRVRVEMAPLATALEDIKRELHEIREALAKRNGAMEDFDEVCEGAALTAFGLFKMAGRPDLAELVRQTPRRRQTA